MITSNATMKAVILEDYRSAAFRLAEIPVPKPAVGQVLVRVKASGVNPIDYKIRRGQAPYAMPDLPAVLGTDLAGIVEAVGEGVEAFAPGDEVYGLTGGVRGLPGSLVEFVAVDADLLARKPANLTMQEAAAIPLVALTAWEGLVDRAKLQPSQSVLVQAGAGGVGHMAVQIAKIFGGKVYATSRGAGLDLVSELGATPIDINAMSVDDYVAKFADGVGFDVVYDTVGGAILDASFAAAAPYGHVVSCAAFGSHNLAPASLRAVSLSGVYVLLPMISGHGRAHHGQILAKITSLVEAGKIRPVLDPRVFTLETAQAAHDTVEQGGARIKIVVTVAA